MDVLPVNSLSTQSVDEGFGLSSEDFLKIYMTELMNQNPLEPYDTKDMVSSMAVLTQTTEISSLGGKMDLLISTYQSHMATSMLGKSVQVAGSEVVGEVAAANIKDNATVTIKTTEGQFIENVSISDIEVVR